MATLTERTIIDKYEIQGYEGLYSITSDGRVWSHPKNTNNKNGKWLSLDTSGRYPMIGLIKDGERKRYLVHRLVSEAYIPNPDDLPQVNHINGVRDDNRVENLEWVTASDNRIHAWETGLQEATESHRLSAKKAAKGRRSFDDKTVVDIRSKYETGNTSQRKLAVEYKTSQAVIQYITSYKLYKEVA